TAVPSVDNTTGLSEAEATPEVASAAVNGTLTAKLFHPAAFAAGLAAPKATVGLVWSTSISIELAVSTLPAWSTDQKVTVWTPSAEIVKALVYVCCAPPSTV